MHMNVRLAAYTALAMMAFAANSLLCRLSLKDTSIDEASFATVRIFSGALMLLLVKRWRTQSYSKHGSWRSAVALFIYVSALSFAYLSLSAGTGAFLLFGAVQTTMTGWFYRWRTHEKTTKCRFHCCVGGAGHTRTSQC
jgi:hypothetical protein